MAMRELAASRNASPLGCTQITEIRYTPGVTLAAPLSGEFELATDYAVAVCTSARQSELARRFAEWMSGPQTRTLRAEGGFET
jgi:molybdate transport system substrate-binding protein